MRCERLAVRSPSTWPRRRAFIKPTGVGPPERPRRSIGAAETVAAARRTARKTEKTLRRPRRSSSIRRGRRLFICHGIRSECGREFFSFRFLRFFFQKFFHFTTKYQIHVPKEKTPGGDQFSSVGWHRAPPPTTTLASTASGRANRQPRSSVAMRRTGVFSLETECLPTVELTISLLGPQRSSNGFLRDENTVWAAP